jgi:hypothetical protein
VRRAMRSGRGGRCVAGWFSVRGLFAMQCDTRGLVAFARCAALHKMRCNALRCAARCADCLRCNTLRGLVAFARCRRRHAFDGGIFRVGFFGIGSTLIHAHTLPGQTEGLKVGCGGMGGRRDGWEVCEVWVGGRMDIRGVYMFSSLMKQNKKAKICFVICFAGKRKLLFYIYAVIVKQKFYKRSSNYYSFLPLWSGRRGPRSASGQLEGGSDRGWE